ncbi:MAG: hypothetical protein ACLFN8_00855 [Candidatus Woesearchaeota archaeon]
MSIEKIIKKTMTTLSAVALISATFYAPRLNTQTYTGKINMVGASIETVEQNPSLKKYQVFTTQKNGEVKVMDNKDTYMGLKFNSKEINNELEREKTYEFTTYQIPFTRNRNILRAKEIK